MQLGLPRSKRSLLMLALMALQSVVLPAQDTMLAKMPQIELIPVPQRGVIDHYINKVWTTKGWQIEVFDGTKASVLRFGGQAQIEVSPNQRYFTVAKPINPYDYGQADAYNVELRNLSNSILAKGRLLTLESDEGPDRFWPADDGLGLIQEAYRPISGSLGFAFFQRQNGGLLRRFAVDKPDFWNSFVSYEPAQKMIVAAIEGHIPGTKVSQTHVQCYVPNGRLRWETTLDGQHVESELFISAFDGTIAFVSQNMQNGSQKNLFFFEKNGKLIRQLPVQCGGAYQHSYFDVINGRQYFIGVSGGEYFYIIDTKSGEILDRESQVKEGISVMGLAIYQQYVFTSYYTGYLRPGPNNTQEPAVKDQGLSIVDVYGRIVHVPLDLAGYPFLYTTKAGLFLREQIGFGLSPQNKFYKIKIKLHIKPNSRPIRKS